MPSPRDPGRGKRAITLVELLVTMTIMLMASGLILGIMGSMRRSTTKNQARLAMQAKAERIVNIVTATLQTAVPPSSLDGPLPRAPIFTTNQCALPHSKRFGSEGLGWVVIQSPRKTQDGVKGTIPAVSIQYEALESDASPPPPLEIFPASVEFRYTTEINSVGLEPEYKDRLESGEYPRIIQMRVRVESDKKELDAFELVTAVRML